MIKNKYNYKNSSIKETYTRQLEPWLGTQPAQLRIKEKA